MERNSTMNGYKCCSTSMYTALQSKQKETNNSDDLKATWEEIIKLDLNREDETRLDSADSGLGTVTDPCG